jgi:ketosteroid isomerase-like protein
MEMAEAEGSRDTTAELHELIETINAAVRAKDSDALVAHYAPDVVLFDLVDPLRYAGIDALRARLQQWFDSFDGPLGYELHDMQLAVSADVAFCYSLNQVKGTRTGGQPLEMVWRATLCFRRTAGRWLVTHGHSSVPFDMESNQASLGLKP